MEGVARQPFQPKGAQPEWQMIYDDLLADADFGSVITYSQLDHVLGRPFLDDRGPIYTARRHLGRTRKRWFEAVDGVGYRIIEAREHLGAAHRRKRRARRQLATMVEIAEVTDLEHLQPDELVEFDRQTKINAALFLFAAQHERRLNRIEDILRQEGKL